MNDPVGGDNILSGGSMLDLEVDKFGWSGTLKQSCLVGDLDTISGVALQLLGDFAMTSLEASSSLTDATLKL